MSFKLMTQSKLTCLEKRVLREINQSQRALTTIIINFASKSVSKAKNNEIAKLSIRDWNLIIKYLDKKIIKSLKSKAAKHVLAQINEKINKIQNISSALKSKIMTFKLLKKKNVMLFICSEKNVTLLNQFIK